MTTEEYSWVVLAFQATYTVMQTVAGSGARRTGHAAGLLPVRGRLGAGQHGACAGHRLAEPRLLPRPAGRDRGGGNPGRRQDGVASGFRRASGRWRPALFQMGTSVGNMIAPPLVAFCILAWGWQSAFLVTGALSLVWAGLWWCGYRTPAEHPRLCREERAHIEPAAGATTSAASPRRARRCSSRASFWAIAIPRFLAEPAWQTFNFFIPLYLVAVWKLDLKSIALWAWLPFLAADFGSLAAGLLPTWLMRRGASLLACRKITMTIGALCMIGPACIGLAGSPGHGDRAVLRRRIRPPDAQRRADDAVRRRVRQHDRRAPPAAWPARRVDRRDAVHLR